MSDVLVGAVSPDRWTCPEGTCGQTVVVDDLDPAIVHARIREAQEEHGTRHRKERTRGKQRRRPR